MPHKLCSKIADASWWNSERLPQRGIAKRIVLMAPFKIILKHDWFTKVTKIRNYSDTLYVYLPFNIEYKSHKQISNKLYHNTQH